MFHVRDGLFFGRRADGSVRIIKMKPGYSTDFPVVYQVYPAHMYEFDITVDENSWASVVASVSSKGESNGRFYEALDFHSR